MLKRLGFLLFIFSLISVNLPRAFPQALLVTPDYASSIMQKVTSCLIYPTEAIRKGWEGIAKVRFTLDLDGRVKEVDIAESSGYPLLDAAAILAIKDASPYPFPNNYPGEQELEIILPVNYSQEFPISPISKQLSNPAEKTQNIPDVSQPFQLSTFTPTPYTGALILPKDSELRNFIEIALENNQPTQVAKKEIEMAEIKVKEAQRNLFPGVKLSAYDTAGEVYKIGYTEREAKLQVNQPIYYGGQLGDTLKQAQVNLEVTQKNYDRQRLEVIQKAETSYYNLVAAKMHLQQKHALLQEAGELLEKIEKLAAAGMAIPLEVTSAKTWYEKIQFQIDTIEQDMHMAELTFQQVLNVKDSPRIEGTILEAKKLDLEFDHCLEVALNNRPEIYLSRLMVKFNEYGKKIEGDKNKFTVDLTSSYGYYQGAYKTERMRSSSNWYVGVKAIKPLGASTLNTSATTDNSQPRFGQTSPTKSTSISAEFNLMDNMKRYSEGKKADIDLSRSVSDFNEAAKTVAFEMQDAFFNYQKAVLQFNEAEGEMKFRRNEAEVTKVRAMVGEADLSNAIQSIYSLSEAQSNYIQALANYYISIANIKKASGYALDL
jgi:outer membrane protein